MKRPTQPEWVGDVRLEDPPGSWSRWRETQQLNRQGTRISSAGGFLRSVDPQRTMTVAAWSLREATIQILECILQVSVEGTAESHPNLGGVCLFLQR